MSLFSRSILLSKGALGPGSYLGPGRGILASSFKFYFWLNALQRDLSYQHRHVTVEFDDMTLFQAFGKPLMLFS